jgi:hypothetical protein
VAALTAGVGLAGGVAAAAWASRVERAEITHSAVATLLVGGVGAIVLAPHPVVAAFGAAGVGAAVNLAWISLEARVLTLRPGQAGTTSAMVSAVAQLAVLVTLVAGVLADGAGVSTALLLYLTLALVFAMLNRRDRGTRIPVADDEVLRGGADRSVVSANRCQCCPEAEQRGLGSRC